MTPQTRAIAGAMLLKALLLAVALVGECDDAKFRASGSPRSNLPLQPARWLLSQKAKECGLSWHGGGRAAGALPVAPPQALTHRAGMGRSAAHSSKAGRPRGLFPGRGPQLGPRGASSKARPHPPPTLQAPRLSSAPATGCTPLGPAWTTSTHAAAVWPPRCPAPAGEVAVPRRGAALRDHPCVQPALLQPGVGFFPACSTCST